MKLIVHIPKTAGTSFRHALEKYLGKKSIVCDYGPNASATSKIVKDFLYTEKHKQTPEKLIKELSNSSAKIIIGHYFLSKYANFFQPDNIITFVRNPLIRMCSEYLHKRRNQSFDGTFNDFLHEINLQNTQSRILNGLSKRSIIGLTESYDESIRFINDFYHWDLTVLKENIAIKQGGKRFANTLPKLDLDLFNTLNKQDIEFYQAMQQHFSELTMHKT